MNLFLRVAYLGGVRLRSLRARSLFQALALLAILAGSARWPARALAACAAENVATPACCQAPADAPDCPAEGRMPCCRVTAPAPDAVATSAVAPQIAASAFAGSSDAAASQALAPAVLSSVPPCSRSAPLFVLHSSLLI